MYKQRGHNNILLNARVRLYGWKDWRLGVETIDSCAWWKSGVSAFTINTRHLFIVKFWYVWRQFFASTSVTHVICLQLAGSKAEQLSKSKSLRIVRPDWVVDSVKEGRLLAESKYSVLSPIKPSTNSILRYLSNNKKSWYINYAWNYNNYLSQPLTARSLFSFWALATICEANK